MTKKILYGKSDFSYIIENNGYYVDKTRFIAELEKLGSEYLFFLRPRRFGKSLLISTLEYYYDINHADKFDKLFGGLYIGKNPTPLKNSYPILKLNLSAVVTHGTLEQIESSFNARVWSSINTFFAKYASVLNIDNIMELQISPLKTASDMLSRLTDYLYEKTIKFYLLIDEYDNFANNILADHGKQRYQEITHGTGFLRNFFTVVKAGTADSTIVRMFATGVSPLVLSDVTSGFNMGDNISQDEVFNEMLGFTELEVEQMLSYYVAQKNETEKMQASLAGILKIFCNNYKFAAHTKTSVFNSNAVLYILSQFERTSRIPINPLDDNMKTDYHKLKFLVLESKNLNGNFDLLNEILINNQIDAELSTSFSANDLIKQDRFISFLYYLGFLTIKSLELRRHRFAIPNDMCKELLWEYLREALKVQHVINQRVLNDCFDKIMIKGDWEPLLKHTFEKFHEATSNRDFIYREEGIKGFMLAYLTFTNAYRVHSEAELNKGYADIYMEPNLLIYPQMCSKHFLIELKHIKKSEITPKNRKKLIDTNIKQAKTQLEQYAKSKNVPTDAIKIIALTTNEELLTLMTT